VLNILIVGAGHAGGAVAANLRQLRSTAPITVVGDEPHLPYQRPPLSKAWLKGDVPFPAVGLRPESYYAQRDITLKLDARVAAIDRAARTIVLASGDVLPYGTLILATGGARGSSALPARIYRASTRCARLRMRIASRRASSADNGSSSSAAAISGSRSRHRRGSRAWTCW
jgi:NADPH-dependent 2,4-dienoyl-CoA reductase/sulfur reductase-like enzyme